MKYEVEGKKVVKQRTDRRVALPNYDAITAVAGSIGRLPDLEPPGVLGAGAISGSGICMSSFPRVSTELYVGSVS